MPCGSANPYLAAAVMLNAALLGVVDGSDCGDPQVGDGDAEPNTDRHTPHDLGGALVALEADSVLCEAMGDDLVKAFLHDPQATRSPSGEPPTACGMSGRSRRGSSSSTCRSTSRSLIACSV